MTFDGLSRRVERLEAAFPPVASPSPVWEEIDKQARAALTDEEYARFAAFIERVKPHISIDAGRLNLRQLSDQDLDILDMWLTLIDEGEEGQAQWSKD